MRFVYALIIALMASQSVVNAVPHRAVPGEYIIRFKSINHARAFFKDQSNRDLGKYTWVKVSFAPMALLKADSPTAAIGKLRGDNNVLYMEPNYVYTIPAGYNRVDHYLNQRYGKPNDKLFDQLWGLSNPKGFDINALKAWKSAYGDKRVVVAVIDTGIDYTHPDLAANMWKNPKEIPGNGIDDDKNGLVDDVYGYDFYNKDGDPMDDNRHGTHCAGTIGAVHNNQIGVAGVMAQVQLMAVKFLSRSGSGSTAAAVESIDYARRMGAHVMSNSWGGGGQSNAMLEAVTAAYRQGIVFVAAAGNSSSDNDTRPMYPASYPVPNVISVAAMDINGNKATFSSYGKKTVHVAAPGVNIMSTVPGGGYQSLSGTSMATPHVSGVVGLVIAAKGLRAAPSMRTRLMQTSKKHAPLAPYSASGGYVDAHAALEGR